MFQNLHKKLILFMLGIFCFAFFGNTHFASALVLQSDLNKNGINDANEPEVVLSSDATLPAGEYFFNNLTITNNATLSLLGDPLSANTFKGVKIAAVNLIIDPGSHISADYKGYGADQGPGASSSSYIGASYGGASYNGDIASIYGSATRPIDLGSGGNSSGGGAIYLVVSDTFTNNGIVSADGNISSSGGSIYVTASNMAGSGKLRANGGNIYASGYFRSPGGGGRVAIYYHNSSFSGTAEAKGGCGSYDGYSASCGQSGTVGMFDESTNDIYINNSWQFRKNDEPFNFNNIYISNNAKTTSENGANITARNMLIDKNSSFVLADNQILNIPTITVDGGSTLTLSGNETITANSLTIKGNSAVTVITEKILSLAIPNITIDSGSSISADRKGYGTGRGPGAAAMYYAGASYGGVGYLNSATSTYGSETEPTDFGSGGAYRGGGAIKLVVSGSLINNGIISADGDVSGSGGSILINANNMAGTGKFNANGGNIYTLGYSKGPGGGGRVAIYYHTSSFSGTAEAKGGCGSYDSWIRTCAGDGTVVMKTSVPAHNPVLIIPGVLGTEINKYTDNLWLNLAHNLTDIGDDFMDPLQFNSDLTSSDTSLTIGDVVRKVTATVLGFKTKLFDYTASLLEEFQNQGYVEGTDLFLFPYDWRYGANEDNVNKLKQKITDILTKTGANKVDVIAHSTGGLLVKKYVIENPSDNHIGKAVFVGVPNTGAPKAIKALIQGDNFGNPFLADSEMKKIAKNLPVAYDLSPSEQYFNIKGSYVKIIKDNGFTSAPHDLDFNETSSFLTQDYQLNSQALINAHNLHTADFDNFDMRTAGVDLYAVDGCKAGTIGKFIESRYQNILGGNPVISQIIENTPGDGTVPLESATNLPINPDHKYYALKAEHGKMLSQDGTRQEIVNLISGKSLAVSDSLITQDITKCKLNGKAISVFSPLDIDVTDQNGNHSGLASDGVSIENNIPNADFEIIGEHKFVYLPNDEGQAYTVNVKGAGNGTFTIKDQDINDNKIAQTQVFSNIPVTASLTGQINLGAAITLSLDSNGDGTIDQTVQPSSVLDPNQSQDLIPPVSTPILTGLTGQPNFYRGDVSINLSAIDPVIAGQENQTSGILKTIYKLEDDLSYTNYLNPITIFQEGKHTLKFFSTDKAGNNETEKSIDFTIDKTAPEFLIQFNPTKKDLRFTGIDNMSSASAIGALDQDDVITLTDQAGNTSQMTLKDKNRQHQLKAEIKSLAYNNQLADITKNKLAFNWKLDKQQHLKELKQYVKSKKDFNIDAVYRNGKTSITGKDQGGRINKLLDGLILLKISTDNGDLNWSY